MLTTPHLDRQVFIYLAMPFAVCPLGSLLYGNFSFDGFDYPRARTLIMGLTWNINKCMVTNCKLHNATICNL